MSKKMLLHLLSMQEVPFCFKEMNRVELTYYNVKKGNNKDEWDFEWRKPFIHDLKVFGIFVLGDKSLQGLIAIRENYDEDFRCLELEIVESAPQNKKMNKGHLNNIRKYIGIGKTLIAFACWYSLKDPITEGYVEFTSKTSKMQLYFSLGAKDKGHQDLVFYPKDSLNVVAKYLHGGVKWCTN